MTALVFTILSKFTFWTNGVNYTVGDETALAAVASDHDIYTLRKLGYVTVDTESEPQPSDSRTNVYEEGTLVLAEVGGINFVGTGITATVDEAHTGRVIVTVGPGTPAITPTTDEGKILSVVSDVAAWTSRLGVKKAFSKAVPGAAGASAFSWTPSYSQSGSPNVTEMAEALIFGNPKGAAFPNDLLVRHVAIVSDGNAEDSAGLRCYMYRDSPTFCGGVLNKKARGSIASPAAVQAGDSLGGFQGMAYHGDDTLNGGWSGNIVAVRLIAAENQTKIAAGTRVDFEVTRIGAAAKRRAISVMPDGSLYAADILDAVATPTNASHFYSNDGKPAFKGEAGIEFLFVQQAHLTDPSADAAALATWAASINDYLEAFRFVAAS